MSTTTTEAATETDTASTTEQEQQQEQQEQATKPTETVDFWKTKAREQEKRAKANAEAAKRLQEIEDEGKSEAERITARAETAETALTDLQNRYHGLLKTQAIAEAAGQARAINAKAVAALIRDDVTVGEDGEVSGMDKAIKALQASDPDLFHSTPAGTNDASAGRLSTSAPNNIPAGTPRLAAAFDQEMTRNRK